MSKRGVIVMLLLGSGLLAGCEALQGDVPCATDSDCAQGGYLCDLEIGLCRPGEEVNRPADAGIDAASADRSIADTSTVVDSSTVDGSTVDSSIPDSSIPDSSTPDSAAHDQQAPDLASVDAIPINDVQDSDDHQDPGPDCSEASPHYSDDAGSCFECIEDSHCNDDNSCTDDTCNDVNTCVNSPVEHRMCGNVLDAGTCADGGSCGVCDVDGLCRILCQSDGECGGRTCDIDAGLCPAGLVP